jgi:hypothetical protein
VNFNRAFTIGAIVVVIGGLGLAFIFLGTPAHQRDVSMDERRTEDLIKIANSLHERYTSGGLPKQVPQFILDNDSVTKGPYEYRRIDRKHYVLCAVFQTDTISKNDSERIATWPPAGWRHHAGRTCYEIDVTEQPATPRRV